MAGGGAELCRLPDRGQRETAASATGPAQTKSAGCPALQTADEPPVFPGVRVFEALSDDEKRSVAAKGCGARWDRNDVLATQNASQGARRPES